MVATFVISQLALATWLAMALSLRACGAPTPCRSELGKLRLARHHIDSILITFTGRLQDFPEYHTDNHELDQRQ